MKKYELVEGTTVVPLESLRVYLDDRTKRDLKKLADYLWDLPDNYEHFDMRAYVAIHNHVAYSESKIVTDVTACGTVACAVGHAPAAGVDVSEMTDYDQLVEHMTSHNRDVFSWLFGPSWFFFDNTTKGAAARIYILLEQGIPEIFIKHPDYDGVFNCYRVVTSSPIKE